MTLNKNILKSVSLFKKAKEYFPGGVNSPVRAFKAVEGSPLFIKKGKGSFIWDEDNNKYIDFCCSYGPLILGHSNNKVYYSIKKAIRNGTSFGAPTSLENELGDLILSNNPFIEKIRFVNSGTEAVMSGIRIARGYTGKNKIIKFEGCYHGHVDSLLVKSGSGLATFGESSSAGVTKGIVKDTIVLPLNNSEALKKCVKENKNDLACIIIEPIPANNGLLLQDKKFLFEKNLNFLFEFFESDKGENFINQYDQPIKRDSNLKVQGHNYAKFYDEYLFEKKDKQLNILEIGSFYGNAAAALYFYFKNAKIYSADIFPDLFSYTSDRIKNFYVDSSSEKSITQNILKKDKKF